MNRREPLIDNIPLELLHCGERWVTWRQVQRSPGEKPTKVPFNAYTGAAASSTDPLTWADAPTACAAFVEDGTLAGIGFVFTEADDILGYDADDVLDDQGEVVNEDARWLLEQIAGAYVEISPSGAGFKAWARGKLPHRGGKVGQFEAYEAGRYFAATGVLLNGPCERLPTLSPETLDRIGRRLFASKYEDAKGKSQERASSVDGAAPAGIEGILSGAVLHDSLRDLAARHAALGLSEAESREYLVALMERSAAKGSDPARWRSRLGQIDELIRSAREKFAPRNPPSPQPAVRWHDVPVPVREWLLAEWVPLGEVSSLYGDGGLGKSLLLQQLLTCIALGRAFMGVGTTGGPALAWFAEDSEDELHRRQVAINAWLGCGFEDLDRWYPVSRGGEDNVLMRFGADGAGQLTAAWYRLHEEIGDLRPVAVGLDPAADVFGGSENVRSHVRQFIGGALRRLSLDHGCAVILLAHPSVYGLTSGTGTGGVTDWSNAVRSRLYLTRDDDNVTRLTRKKANYAASGDDVVLDLHYSAGVFWEKASAIESRTKEERAREVFVACLKDAIRNKTNVTANPRGAYAPKAFSAMPKAKAEKLSRKALEDAMHSLLEDGAVVVREGRSGSVWLDLSGEAHPRGAGDAVAASD